MKKISNVYCTHPAQIGFTFDGDTTISFIWGKFSHTDNYMSSKGFYESDWISTNVEAYSVDNEGNNAINGYLKAHYGEAPATVPVDDIPKVLNDIRSLK